MCCKLVNNTVVVIIIIILIMSSVGLLVISSFRNVWITIILTTKLSNLGENIGRVLGGSALESWGVQFYLFKSW